MERTTRPTGEKWSHLTISNWKHEWRQESDNFLKQTKNSMQI